MHSWQGDKTVFHFDGGLLGEVIIIDKETKQEVRVLASDLLKLVAYHYVIPKRVGEIEDMDYENLLK